MTSPTRPRGLTKDVGWQIGVSRTFPVGCAAAWDFLLSPAGLALWLGDGVRAPLEKGVAYETGDGTTGQIRSLRPLDRVRLTWKPPSRDRDATLQVTVRPAATGCSVRFHTERLENEHERIAMRSHWRAVLDRLPTELPPSAEQ